MANAKEKFTSPKGNLKWCFVSGKGKETEANSGQYKYSVVVSADESNPEVQEAIKLIDAFWTENRPKASKVRPKTTAYKYEEDDQTGERTGKVYFSFSTKTTFPSGDPKIVKVFSAKSQAVLDLGTKLIGDESEGRGMGSLAIYEYNGSYGTTLFLDAISLSKFREYVGGVDASEVVVDEDAEDIDLGVETKSVEDVNHESGSDTPRV